MMLTNRRQFLRLAGLACLGLGAGAGLERLSGADLARAAAPDATGTRLALVIDLPKCLAAGDCTDCSQACHAAHNVPRYEEEKEEIKWLWKETFAAAFHEDAHTFLAAGLSERQVPVLCNHCDNPPCVRVCPTQATWKRADGIVMMDYHRCIGCRYCMVACPYGARSFNYRDPRLALDVDNLTSSYPTRTRGVVEKCNFCAERLAKDLAPACVEGCKAKAMFFGNLSDPQSQIRALLASRHSLRRTPALGTSPQVYYLL